MSFDLAKVLSNYLIDKRKKYFDMKKRCLLLILVSFVLISCNRHFNEFGLYQGCRYTILLDSNHVFWSSAPNPYWGPRDTCSGTWTEKNGYLILNSYRQLNNEKDFNVNEEFCDSISSKYKVIQVQTGPFFWQEGIKDSVMIWFNKMIVVNNVKYTIPYNGKLILQIKEVNTIEYSWRFSDFPIYHVKNIKSNYFYIHLDMPDSRDDSFQTDSYYYNAKFEIGKNSLKYKNDSLNKVSTNIVDALKFINSHK